MLPHKEKAVSTNLHKSDGSRRAASVYTSAVKPADFPDKEASDMPFSVQDASAKHRRFKRIPTPISPSQLPEYVYNRHRQFPVDICFPLNRVRLSITTPGVQGPDYNDGLPSGMSNLSDSDPEVDFAKEKVDAVMTGVASKLGALQSQDTVGEDFDAGKTTRSGTEFGGATGQFAKEVKK